jgi:transposase-like protein
MAEEAPKKRPVGRPSKYKPEFCERMLEMAAEGCGMAEYAAEFGIDRTTLFDWAASHEDFSTALTRAKIIEQSWWEREARLNVKNKDFNANLWYRCAASRFREDYTERKSTEVSGPNGGAIKTESAVRLDTRALDPEQREALKIALQTAVESAGK